MHLIRIGEYMLGLVGDVMLLIPSIETVRLVLKAPQSLPKRPAVEGMISEAMALMGFTSVFFFPISLSWFVLMVLDVFGLGTWAILDMRMLEKIGNLHYEKRLAEATWFHRTFYRRYLRSLQSETLGI